MKLSVLMITYNHERFIRQALDSVLMQDVDFDYEIVVGEDVSKDATRQILLEYKERYPQKIRPLLRDKNLGAVTNFYNTMSECRGQYIALLEGDDYWTDKLKLRKQVAFLDANPDYVSCFHNVLGRYEDGSQPDYHYVRADHKSTLELEDLLTVNLIPTCSTVFRRGLIEPIPQWAYALKMADYPLHVLTAQHGKIGYLDEMMGVYRVHKGGVWTAMDAMSQLKTDLRLFQELAKGVQPRFRPAVRQALSLRQWCVACACEDAGDMSQARRYLLESIAASPFSPRPRLRAKLKVLTRVTTPAMYRLVQKTRKALPRGKSPFLPTLRGPVPSPRVSIVMPAYNAERYLHEAVASVLTQSFEDFECIIVDDGSIDHTPSYLAELSERDGRIRPIRIAHGGIVEALNAGVREARGELLARMDADDICMPNRLEKQVRYLDSHPECVAVGSNVMMVDPFNSTLSEIPVKNDHEQIEADLLRGNGWAIFHPTAVIRTEVLRQIGGYRREYQWSEDIDLFLRLAEHGKLANLPEPLLRYRQHFSSVNRTKLELQRNRSERVLAEAYARRGLPVPPRFNIDLGPQLTRYQQTLAWGKHALQLRSLRAARLHAFAALRIEPLRYESWSFAYHALAGR